MLFRKELQGKEIIDREGKTVGLIEDVDLTEKGRVTKIVALPKGIVNRITKRKLHIGIEDIEMVSHLVMLNKTEEELRGIYRCKECGQVFETEQGRKAHHEREHTEKKKPVKTKKTKTRKKR